MSANHLETPVTLTLEAADIVYLRDFLYEESISAEVDFDNVETLHNDRARQAAKMTLSREHTKMTKIIDALDATLNTTEGRVVAVQESVSMTDPLQAADEVGTETEEGK